MKLTLTNLHPSLRPPPAKWRRIIRRLYESVARSRGRFRPLELEQFNVVWMDDVRMAEANWRFLRHEGPTDILTFHYSGESAEILISLDTARENAREHGQT